MNRKDSIDKIAKYLARFSEEVKSYNESNLYDINIHAENALIPILNSVFDIQLQNVNSLNRKNFPAVDLVDFNNRIAFQVTSTGTGDKVKNTLIKFFDHDLRSKFDTLYIFILTEKEAKYSDKIIKENIPEDFDFDAHTHIIDFGDLRQKISYLQSLEKLQHLARICEHEFSDVQIETRKKKYELGYLKNTPESLYPNFLEILFPQSLYIADLNIDIEVAKEKINSWRESKGWGKKRKFKQGELLRNEMIEKKVFSSEWILRENKIHTFRNLHDSKEGLSNFVDKGTIVDLRPEEYYLNSEAHLNNFKHLLKNCLISYCRLKELEWVAEDEIIRFKNNPVAPNQKRISWKAKNNATKTVIFEMTNKKLGHIICFRSMAFKPLFELYGDKWVLIINPTWSFTNPGGVYKSRFEAEYMSGIKRQENNNAVYYQYRFFAYYLSYIDLFTQPYDYMEIRTCVPFDFTPSIDDSKWLPPRENELKNELDVEIKIDNELTQFSFE